ncbi:MAG: hypothetical protein OXC95_17135 [Dehalococcoidia bacterium]|nr:hypothetical protein [Dehalococcoidia bacterium]
MLPLEFDALQPRLGIDRKDFNDINLNESIGEFSSRNGDVQSSPTYFDPNFPDRNGTDDDSFSIIYRNGGSRGQALVVQSPEQQG